LGLKKSVLMMRVKTAPLRPGVLPAPGGVDDHSFADRWPFQPPHHLAVANDAEAVAGHIREDALTGHAHTGEEGAEGGDVALEEIDRIGHDLRLHHPSIGQHVRRRGLIGDVADVTKDSHGCCCSIEG
jgi:hypothetical protein